MGKELRNEVFQEKLLGKEGMGQRKGESQARRKKDNISRASFNLALEMFSHFVHFSGNEKQKW